MSPDQTPTDLPLSNFKEFWPYYVCEHGNPKNRWIHFTGTSLTILILAAALISGNYVWLWAMPIAGYGFAWVGHFFVERNRPATFKAPFYSLAGDFKMFFMILTGRMNAEVERCKQLRGVAPR